MLFHFRVDFNAAVTNSPCFLHSGNIANSRRNSPGVNHYQLVARCGQELRKQKYSNGIHNLYHFTNFYHIFLAMGLECTMPSLCTCPANQVYTECGSACTANCTRQGFVCTLQCVRRCECPHGFVQLSNENQTCVEPDMCPSKYRTRSCKQPGVA